jgi:hypothetical protein
MPHAELPEAERAQEALGVVDPPKLLGRDRIAVLEPRRQARERRLVPRGQAQLARQVTDLGLPELGFDQRRTHAHLRRGVHAGAVIAEVVHVRAVHDRARFVARERRELREELFFAVEAAVDRVARIVGVVELPRLHDDVAHAEERGQPPRLLELAHRVRLGVRRHEHGGVAERVLGGAREERRIDAAGERDDDALHAAQHVQQALVLRGHALSRRAGRDRGMPGSAR